jgi:hypothetical protein
MRMWKVLGLAGIVGATAVGVAYGAKRAERQRREYREADPDELRSRLHQRLADLDGAAPAPNT